MSLAAEAGAPWTASAATRRMTTKQAMAIPVAARADGEPRRARAPPCSASARPSCRTAAVAAFGSAFAAPPLDEAAIPVMVRVAAGVAPAPAAAWRTCGVAGRRRHSRRDSLAVRTTACGSSSGSRGCAPAAGHGVGCSPSAGGQPCRGRAAPPRTPFRGGSRGSASRAPPARRGTRRPRAASGAAAPPRRSRRRRRHLHRRGRRRRMALTRWCTPWRRRPRRRHRPPRRPRPRRQRRRSP
mmetsp:Transcript_30590/g.94501  ORF Transcript_30590/g.94501 Transcript_30590/m.94501 type:complete len:241 (-) Transcript_30590:604-1326(-)